MGGYASATSLMGAFFMAEDIPAGFHVPLIRSDEWYDDLVKRVFGEWACKVFEHATANGLHPRRYMAKILSGLKEDKKSLKRPTGLSDGEAGDPNQRILKLPGMVDNILARDLGADWPRTHPTVWRRVYEYFQAGHMGKFEGSQAGGRDWGGALGSGDED